MIETLSNSEFSKLFNERAYNPVAPELREGAFSARFQEVIETIDEMLKEIGFEGEYYLHDSHNWTHVIDVHFETDEADEYLETDIVRKIAEFVVRQPDDWMVILADSTKAFITKQGIKIFNYQADYPMIETLGEQVQDVFD